MFVQQDNSVVKVADYFDKLLGGNSIRNTLITATVVVVVLGLVEYALFALIPPPGHYILVALPHAALLALLVRTCMAIGALRGKVALGRSWDYGLFVLFFIIELAALTVAPFRDGFYEGCQKDVGKNRQLLTPGWFADSKESAR